MTVVYDSSNRNFTPHDVQTIVPFSTASLLLHTGQKAPYLSSNSMVNTMPNPKPPTSAAASVSDLCIRLFYCLENLFDKQLSIRGWVALPYILIFGAIMQPFL